ncbi:phage tail assembly chaperone [Pseudomonas fluorescens]|uniref:phage tail assembly chaperone n=1 Tax=Pseudomonas fluorescens TaxID=294 RepID=UPI003523A986
MKYATFDDNGVLLHRLIAGVHSIPSDAIPVDEALWFRLIQEEDGIWKVDEGVISKHPLIEVAPDLAGQERGWRDSELQGVMWLRDRHRDQLDIAVDTTLSDDQFKALLVYMQALRDWPQSPDFPDSQHRPIAPDWIAEQTE